jgi:hypothetical protein
VTFVPDGVDMRTPQVMLTDGTVLVGEEAIDYLTRRHDVDTRTGRIGTLEALKAAGSQDEDLVSWEVGEEVVVSGRCGEVKLRVAGVSDEGGLLLEGLPQDERARKALLGQATARALLPTEEERKKYFKVTGHVVEPVTDVVGELVRQSKASGRPTPPPPRGSRIYERRSTSG